MRLQDEEGLKAFPGSKIRPRMSKHFRFKHNVAYSQILMAGIKKKEFYTAYIYPYIQATNLSCVHLKCTGALG